MQKSDPLSSPRMPMSSSSINPLTDFDTYETQRIANMRANQALLLELGLGGSPTFGSKKKAAPRTKPTFEPRSVNTRRTLASGLPVPDDAPSSDPPAPTGRTRGSVTPSSSPFWRTAARQAAAPPPAPTIAPHLLRLGRPPSPAKEEEDEEDELEPEDEAQAKRARTDVFTDTDVDAEGEPDPATTTEPVEASTPTKKSKRQRATIIAVAPKASPSASSGPTPITKPKPKARRTTVSKPRRSAGSASNPTTAPPTTKSAPASPTAPVIAAVPTAPAAQDTPRRRSGGIWGAKWTYEPIIDVAVPQVLPPRRGGSGTSAEARAMRAKRRTSGAAQSAPVSASNSAPAAVNDSENGIDEP